MLRTGFEHLQISCIFLQERYHEDESTYVNHHEKTAVTHSADSVCGGFGNGGIWSISGKGYF